MSARVSPQNQRPVINLDYSGVKFRLTIPGRPLLTSVNPGADDYIRKPFSVRELVARVRALLRRAEADAHSYEDEQLSIDFDGMGVSCEGREVRLTRREFALPAVLAECAGRVATKKYLLERVWGYQYYGGERTLDVHVRRLRQSLGRCGERIETVTGVGYRFARSTPGAGPSSRSSSS